MKAQTRVEKYQKLREEITAMPNEGELSNGASSFQKMSVSRPESSDDSSAKGAKSTIEFGIDEIMASINQSETDDDKKELTPIQRQKRKEFAQAIVLIVILVILLIGVAILGIYAF
ncbi:MAG: hypothetical protein EOM77_03830 [Bacteroidia bacterium]|nr:hypothetical protein [Bacteroidia bacterium]